MSDSEAESNKAASDSAALDGLVDQLRSKYTRPQHGTRLDQIEALTVSLTHLVEQLSDEDMREADHEKRLIADFSSGDAAKMPVPGSDAHRKLVAAMAAQNGGN